MSDFQPRSGAEILRDLDKATQGLQGASRRLSKLSQLHHEATVDEATGEVTMGTGLRYEVALEEEISEIYELAEKAEKRPPPADVREARAKRAVKVKHPDLWADYQRESSEIEALKLWISSAKANINGLQTLRKGEAP